MKKSTWINLFIAFAYSTTLLVGMYLGYKFLNDEDFTARPSKDFVEDTVSKRDQIINIIGNKYVDEVNSSELNKLPIDSILHQLDPHSVYLPPLKAYEFSEKLDGNFEGIGIQYYILNDTLLITNVLKDGPAYAAGVRLGDKILKIDTSIVSGRSLPREKMIGKIKGKSGTAVQLLLKRNNVSNPLLFSVKRGKVAVSSIDAAYMLTNEVGYIRISKFGAATGEDFTESLQTLKSKGMKKLVLDLRDNVGGYLSAATSLANQLFPENKLIVYTEGKHDPRTDYISLGGGEFEQGKLAVLINENTASASEIIAGAVQDQDRGIIIGRRSFGKGLVQEQFPFVDGSALNLTIARYFTPLGRSIQKSYKNGYQAYLNELEDRLQDGELTANSPALKDTVNKKAFVTVSGKKLYAGGGILPDVYVKLDTAGFTKFYNNIVSKRILFDFVYAVLADRYNATWLEQNINDFNISEVEFKELIRYAQERGVVADAKQISISKPLLLADMKLLLYKYYLGDMGYYKAQNLTDPMIKQALSRIQ